MNFEYDTNGNIFLKHNDEYYMLDIDKNDDVCFEKIYNKIYNTQHIDNLTKKIESDSLNKLYMKGMQEATEEINQNLDLQDYDENQIQEIASAYNEINMNPEYHSYKDCEYELDNECYDDNEPNKFEIFTNTVNKSDLLYEPPSYETIIYKNNIIQMRTKLTNNQPFYRLSIHIEGKIQLNIIGTKLKFYIFDVDTLKINKIDESYIKIM